MARLGSALIALGVLVLGYAGLWQLGLAPGSRVTLPPPVFIPVGTPTPTPFAPTPTAVVLPTPIPALEPIAPPATLVPRPQVKETVEPRAQLQQGGYAVRLAIPAIKLETPVQQGGIVTDDNGEPAWETLPFVAVHYGDLTARVGARGNAVIAGHVVTLQEGNVFRFLYQLDFDDMIEVWDEQDVRRDFRVIDVRLVSPADVSVMAPTDDITLTLITCGGTFDPVKREFSERLIVTAKPL